MEIQKNKERKDYYWEGLDSVDKFLPGCSVDCIVLGYEDQQVKILLLKWKDEDMWMLPGGAIYKDEDIDNAAHRILRERTSLESIFLKQFHTFGKYDRPSLTDLKLSSGGQQMIEGLRDNHPEWYDWFDNRFVSVGYFAFVDIAKSKCRPADMSDKCEWIGIHNLPKLMMDHGNMITKALDFIRIQLNYLPISMNLLPREFTMQDLQVLYESILERKLERSNFQRKMLKLGVFVRLDKKMTGAANKAPYLYCFDKEKYDKLLEEGVGFV